MTAIKYKVELTQSERASLKEVTSKGRLSARKMKRALALLRADGGMSDPKIAEAISMSADTVARVRKRFAEEGLERALNERPRPGQKRKLDGRQEAHLVAIACSDPPKDTHTGRSGCLPTKWWRWSLRRAYRLRRFDRYSKNELKPWKKKEWCIPKVSGEFVARMEDVLDLYGEDYDPERPVSVSTRHPSS